MKYEQELRRFPFGTMIYGSLMALLMILGLTMILAVFTEFGWAGIENWPLNTVNLVLVYSATVFGSIAAGRRSGRQGWVVGVGVGILASLLLLIIAFMGGRTVHAGIFLVKAAICGFIGLFGGIIGVNITNYRT